MHVAHSSTLIAQKLYDLGRDRSHRLRWGSRWRLTSSPMLPTRRHPYRSNRHRRSQRGRSPTQLPTPPTTTTCCSFMRVSSGFWLSGWGDSTVTVYLDKTVKRQSVRPFLSHMYRRGETSPLGVPRAADRSGERQQVASIRVWVRPSGTLTAPDLPRPVYRYAGQAAREQLVPIFLLSLCTITPTSGRRRNHAMRDASLTSSIQGPRHGCFVHP